MSKAPENFREIESGIHTDLKDRLTYEKYLSLDTVLNAQHSVSTQHDEMLFIIIHQASELWLKLAGHELEAARRNVRDNDFRHAFKVIATAGTRPRYQLASRPTRTTRKMCPRPDRSQATLSERKYQARRAG